MELSEICSDERARLIFGKRELEITQKQLWDLPLSQAERNMLTRIRKKLVFIAHLSQCIGEFWLERGALFTKAVEEVLTLVQDHPLADRVQAILLFGSHADGTATWRSDIDIAVVFDRISRAEATRFRRHVAGRAHVKIDIQVWNELPAAVRRSIATNHKMLYRKATFHDSTFTRVAIGMALEHERKVLA